MCKINCAISNVGLLAKCTWIRTSDIDLCESKYPFASPKFMECIQKADDEWDFCREPYLICSEDCDDKC